MNDMSWADWTAALSSKANNLIADVQAAKQLYDKFYALTYGLTDPQILALGAFSNKTQTDLTNIRAAMGAFNDLYSALFGGAALTAVARIGFVEPFV
jgi:hypothetical protein